MAYEGENPANTEPGAAGLPKDWSNDAQQPAGNSVFASRPQQVDLMKGIEEYTQHAHTKPMPEAGQVAAITIVGGIAARAFNIDGSGLSQFSVLVAPTGTGKGAVQKIVGKLLSEVAPSLKGMGFMASGQALIKELADPKCHPHRISCFDELGHDFIQMKNPRNENAKTKEKVLLQLWQLSGKGNVFDPMGYSDREKNTGTLESPAFTFSGTTTPNLWNSFVDENSSASGFIGRLNVVESTAPIPPDNPMAKWHFDNPPRWLIDGLADLTATALTLAQNRQVHDIAFGDGAEAEHRAFSEYVRVTMNAHDEGPARHLWSRAAEKALRHAGAKAVGINWHCPVVTREIAQDATRYIDRNTRLQTEKIINGETGEQIGNQNKQHAEVIRVIKEYIEAPYERYSQY